MLTARYGAKVRRRCDRQKYLLSSAVEANLQRISQLVHLDHRATDADLTEHGHRTQGWLAQCDRAQCDQGWERQLAGHPDALQILIVNDIVLRGRADGAADPISVSLQDEFLPKK